MSGRKLAMRAAVGCALLAAVVAAQDLTPKAAAQSRPIVLVGATLHRVSGPPVKGDLRFAGGKLTHVGSAPRADGEEVVDGAGMRVYPGFVAPWTQLGLTEIGSVRATQDLDETGAIAPEALAVTAVNPDSWLLPVTRRSGVLTALTAPTGGAMAGRASVVRMDGWTTDDLRVVADAGVVITWPRMRTGGGRFGRFGGGDAADSDGGDAVKAALALIDDAVRDALAYFDAKAADPALATDVRWEALRAVLRPADEASRRPAFVLADEHDQIQSAVAWAGRRGIRMILVGGREADLCADLLKKRDVPVILNGVFQMPKRADAAYDEAFTRPRRLQELGVRWCLASGEETPHERNLPYAAGLAAAYGLPPEAALRSVTLSAAEILGVADRLGSLDVGKAATLFLCDGDPLEVRSRIRRAWIDGREIALTDKQEALYEKYRKRYAETK